MCKTSAGCPIGEDIASDPIVNEVATTYGLTRTQYESDKCESLYIASLKSIGLDQEPDALRELEFAYQNNQIKRMEEAGQKAEAASRAKAGGSFRTRARRR